MTETIKANGKVVSRAALLAALHNNTRAIGMGQMHDLGRDMTREEAEKVLEDREGVFAFDYLLGRPLKVFEKDGAVQRSDLYDRDAGRGAFDRAVEEALK